MKLQDAITLIKHPELHIKSVSNWADFGSGEGLFTRALATLLAPGSKIYAIDKNTAAFTAGNNADNIVFEKVNADFTNDLLPISDLDGIIMANSLHFVSDKGNFIKNCSKYFKGPELFVIVEYDTDQGNPWVPYPVSFESLKGLFSSLGFKTLQKIEELPSRYNNGKIYSSLIRRP